jgi:hypothetical protein
VLPASDYVLDVACEPARLSPVFGTDLAAHLASDRGCSPAHSTQATVLPVLCPKASSSIALRVGSLYGHREEMAVLSRGRIDPLPFVDGLLDGFKVSLV